MKYLNINMLLTIAFVPATAFASTDITADIKGSAGNKYSNFSTDAHATTKLKQSHNFTDQLNKMIREKKSTKIEEEINAKLEKYLSEF